MRLSICLSRSFLLLSLLVLGRPIFAQTTETARATALRFLQGKPHALGLEATDVSDLHITDTYVSKHNGLTHVWIQQQYRGIPVFNALFGLHVAPNGTVWHTGHHFVVGLTKRVQTTLPSIAAAQALERVLQDLGFGGFNLPRLREKINSQHFVFEGGAVARTPIVVALAYKPQKDGSVPLVWTLQFEPANTADAWHYAVDAQNGQILYKYNRVLYCHAGHPEVICSEQVAAASPAKAAPPVAPMPPTAGATYQVFPLPLESPSHGSRNIVSEPLNTASPYGWHDTNGASGAEYTYTRGNNAWAYDDSANDNIGSEAESVSGGAAMNFSFPYDPDGEPVDNRNAAITNLFYTTNMMHDLFYGFGFDEQGGSFQVNNYGRGGFEKDHVNAEALDGSGSDNANFDPTPDGFQGRMQMYTWNRGGGRVVTVNAPEAVANLYYAGLAANWGGAVTGTPLTAEVVFTDDGTGAPQLGCQPPVIDVAGKIGMVDRGVCEFGQKALLLEQAGAVGCIVCDHGNPPITGLGPGTVGGQVKIPVVWMKKGDCDLLRQYAGNGLNISLVTPPVQPGPEKLDGSFDNGIIAHEYTHGVSNRLTGGPNTVLCLDNAEQMGEGWSDWFSLVATLKPTDLATNGRGIGTYVLRENTNALGIRRYPYSTDMQVNPLTYESILDNPEKHALGEAWTAMLWDLYWALVDKYGYDANLNNRNSGNARAIQLVMDGMKLQRCNPGFVDGRNAILKADSVYYNAADACLIWHVFARRGLGVGADQGDTDSAADGTPDFSPLPACLDRLALEKKCPPDADPGQIIEIFLKISNYKAQAVPNVVLTDELPQGLGFVTASHGGVLNGNVLRWNLGTLAPGQSLTVTYKAMCDPTKGSIRLFRDVMDAAADWEPNAIVKGGPFSLQGTVVKTGTAAWKAETYGDVTDYALERDFLSPLPISGTRPVLRFWQRYDTEKGVDAVFLEAKINNSLSWNRFDKQALIRNGYPGRVQYTTFAIPNLSGFSGTSNTWAQSYFDLGAYKGEDILLRFRCGTNNTGPTQKVGTWYVDDVELIDLLAYDGEACVSSGNGDNVCAKAPGGGVAVGFVTVSASESPNDAFDIQVQPNPAHEVLHLTFGQSLSGARLSLLGADGRLALQQPLNAVTAGQTMPVEVHNLPAGVYLLRVESVQGSAVRRVVLK